MLPNSSIDGFAKLMADYEVYCHQTEAKHQKPVSFLGYLASLF